MDGDRDRVHRGYDAGPDGISARPRRFAIAPVISWLFGMIPTSARRIAGFILVPTSGPRRGSARQ